MKHCYIDFADRTILREILAITPSRWLFSATSIIFLIFCVGKMYHVVADIEKTNMSIASIQSHKTKALVPTQINTIPSAKIEATNIAIKQLNLPWSDLFDALENSTTQDIALLDIEPDAVKGILKIQGETSTSTEMITFVEKLKQQKIFFDAYIAKHEISERTSQKPLRFLVETKWRKEIQ